MQTEGLEQEMTTYEYSDYIQHYIASARLVVQALIEQEMTDQPLMEAFRSIDP